MSALTDFETLNRPGTPNTYLVLPEGFSSTAEADQVSPVFAEAPQALYARLVQLVSGRERWTLEREEASQLQLEAIAKTRLLKFKDDISIRVVPSGQGAALAIYSRSRVGHSDLGANRKRVQALLEELKQNTSGAA